MSDTTGNVEGRIARWSKSETILLVARIGVGMMTLLSPFILAAALWIGNTLWQLNTSTTKLATQLMALTAQVGQVGSNAYTREEAKAAEKSRDIVDRGMSDRITQNFQSVQENRGRIRKLEAGGG